MRSFFKRLIPNNIAGILGIIGVVIPLIRELIMVGLRIIAVFYPKAESLIESIGKKFDSLTQVWDNIKRFLLGLETK